MPEEGVPAEPGLEKSLSFKAILLITINSIMGTGIFFLPALGAHPVTGAGNASIISWAIMAAIAMMISFVFAELSSMFPTAGGVYEYCKQAFGAFPSYVIGWTTLVVGNLTIAMLVVGAIQYLNEGLPNIYKIIFSIVFILLFNLMAFRGMQTSAVMLIAFAIVTLTSLFGLIIPGIFAFNPSNLTPFVSHSWPVIFLTVFIIAETFFGWETATFLAEETKDAERIIPKALILGTAIICVIALVFVIVSLGVLPYQEFGISKTPLSDLAAAIYGPGAASIFTILVYVSIIGSVAGWIVSAPRLMMSLAEDKMFIEQLAQIHPVYKTPYKAILFQTILTSLLVVIGAGSYEFLLHLLVPLVLLLYAAVIIAFLVLRKTQADTPRPFKVSRGIALGTFLTIFLIGLVVFWGFTDPKAVPTILVASSWILFGLPVYILLKFTYDPDALLSANKATARLNVMLENFFVPRSIRKHLLSLIQIEGKKVLEYGANVGTFTLALAERIGPGGVLYTVDVSKDNVRIVTKRVRNKGHVNVRIIHDEHQINRVHPDVDDVDVVVSFGFLSYVQDMRKVLRDMRERMQENGVILFVDYVDYFKILPNAGMTANPKELMQICKEEGFSVKVERKKGIFWNYLVVHGIRTDRDIPFV